MSQVLRLTGLGMQAQLARNVIGVPATGLTATGSSSQANSYAITEDVSVFTTAANNSGARLPATCTPGDTFVIFNGDGNTLLVYPPVGGKMNLGTLNSSVSLATVTAGIYICTDGLNFIGGPLS